jgi:hypothetical protein
MDPHSTRVGCSLALACLAALGGCGPGDRPELVPAPADDGSAPQAPDPTESPGATLVVAFMLDPRLTGSVYMGERWVTPETFTLIHEGELVSMRARAHVDERNGRRDVSASWRSADPGMLTVPLEEAHEVEPTVHRAGQTTLTVTDGERSTSLTVVAVEDGGRWRVDISR